MRKIVLPLVTVLILTIPNVLFSLFGNWEKNEPLPIFVSEAEVEMTEQSQQTVLVKDEDTILELELDAYILGVLLGEMPADFEQEALKAQAVATRTYTLRRVAKQSKHDDANLCTQSNCCQAYVMIPEYLSRSGEEKDVEKLKNALEMTKGQVLTFDGNLIEATYFSCSGGRTEDAVDVWGENVPYLKSVESPGEEASRHYTREITFSKQEFLTLIGLPNYTPLTESSITITYTEGGGVDTLWIGDDSFSGVQLRSLLSLPSTYVSLNVSEENVVISAKGNGHRVGMSQYGADAMAVSGKTYTEILSHYYPGTKLETFTPEQINAIFDKAGNL